MILRQRVRVVFNDGNEEVFRVTPKMQVDLERKFELSLLECNNLEHTFYVAWLALGVAGKERGRNFDHFLDMIDGAELLPIEDEEPPDPTRPEASSGTSSSSASAPASRTSRSPKNRPASTPRT